MAAYALPDLPYDYSALEPAISGKLLELHHTRHHAAYVNGANKALEDLQDKGKNGDATKIAQLTGTFAFNLAGHENHSLFWRSLSPKGGGKPSGKLASVIEKDFGSFRDFQNRFGTVASTIQGSGWAILAYEPIAQKAVILQLHDHQNCMSFGAVPLLLIDMWEHAFYLDYLNEKGRYIDAFWEIANWQHAADQLAKAQGIAA